MPYPKIKRQKFSLETFLPKRKIKKEEFIDILYSPNRCVIDDFYLPDAFHTCIGEQVNANFQQ